MEKKNKIPNIYSQAAIALMLIQLVHKIVREIPGSAKMEGPGIFFTSIVAGLLLIGIILIFFKMKLGLILGIISGASMIFQPIYVHIITAHPDQNGIWWYPIFPWIQALLIIYFCGLAWNKLKRKAENNS